MVLPTINMKFVLQPSLLARYLTFLFYIHHQNFILEISVDF